LVKIENLEYFKEKLFTKKITSNYHFYKDVSQEFTTPWSKNLRGHTYVFKIAIYVSNYKYVPGTKENLYTLFL